MSKRKPTQQVDPTTTSSATECTGLMQTLPDSEQQAASYEAIYTTHWPKVNRQKRDLPDQD